MTFYQRRELIRVPPAGLIHPRDIVSANPIHEPFITQKILHDRIRTLAHHIAEDHHGKTVQLIPILNGAVPFTNALLAELQQSSIVTVYSDPVQISSYRGRRSTGQYTLHTPLPQLKADTVLIVDGIVDTGGSAKFLLDQLHERGAKEIGVCTLLHKRENTKHLLPLQYIGFEIPNVYVVGFGMDCDQQYRELPYVAKMRS